VGTIIVRGPLTWKGGPSVGFFDQLLDFLPAPEGRSGLKRRRRPFRPRRTCTPQPSNIVIGGPEAPARARLSQEQFAPVRTFLTRARTMGRLIDLYAFDLVGEVVDAAATSTRRFGPVLVATTVHAPDGEGGPGKAAELSIIGKNPRPDGARLTVGTPFSGSATFRKRPGMPATWQSTKLERACERSVAPPHTAG
jgi:hypothetical protein